MKKGGLRKEKTPTDQCFQCCHYSRLGPGHSLLCPVSCVVKCLAVSLTPPPQDASSTFLSSSETQKCLQTLPNVLGGKGTTLYLVTIHFNRRGKKEKGQMDKLNHDY